MSTRSASWFISQHYMSLDQFTCNINHPMNTCLQRNLQGTRRILDWLRRWEAYRSVRPADAESFALATSAASGQAYWFRTACLVEFFNAIGCNWKHAFFICFLLRSLSSRLILHSVADWPFQVVVMGEKIGMTARTAVRDTDLWMFRSWWYRRR